MLYLVVAGIPGCRKFAGITTMGEYLENKYSFFLLHKIYVKPDKWKDWLKHISKKNGWNHYTLPIVWKELPYRGGKQCLIGGYSRFMKYCIENYGVKLSLSKGEMRMKGIEMLAKDLFEEEGSKSTNILPRCMCICGANALMLQLILPLLLKIPGLATVTGFILGLYDEDIKKRGTLKEFVEEFDSILPSPKYSSQIFTAHVVNKLETAVAVCDLLLVIVPEFNDNDAKDEEWWSLSIAYATRVGSAIAFAAKNDIRVILVGENQGIPICLCAAALAQAAQPNVKSHNVVAITAGIGIMFRSVLSYSLNLPLSYIKNVPVWGFSDISHIVEPTQATISIEVQSCSLSLDAKEWIVNPNFRMEFIKSYLWPLIGRRLEEMKILLRRNPCLIQVEALSEIVSHWYSENITKKHTFLGIYSDGTFGIPPGIFFSQPVNLVNGIWRPNQEYPVPTDPYCKIYDLFDTAILFTESFVMKDKVKTQLMGFEIDSWQDDDLTKGKNGVEIENGWRQKNSDVQKNQDIDILSVEEIEVTEVKNCLDDDVELQENDFEN